MSFTERLQQVQGIRVLLAVAGLLICLTSIGKNASHRPPLLTATAVYLLAVLVGALFWRHRRSHQHLIHGTLLGADGVYLVLVVALSGGTGSPTCYLLLLAAVATTLLVSYRSGVRLTLWMCLLLQVAYQTADRFRVDWWRFPEGPDAERGLVSFSVALVAVVLLVATAGAFNERALRSGRRDLEVLAALGHDLERVVEPHLVAEQLCIALAEGYQLERSVIAELAGDCLLVLASRGTPPLTRIVVDETTRTALASDTPVLLRTLPDDAGEGLATALPGARDVILIAMRNGDDVLGVVVAVRGRTKRGVIRQRVLSALEQMVAHTTLSLQRANLLVEMSRLADTDVLTGLTNRGAFDRSLTVEIDRAQRQGTPLGLLIADLDHFKRINDEMGHPTGDAVLREVGALLRQDLRGSDVAARYGGEEFALLLPGCPLVDLPARAERLRLKVKETRFSASDVTLSVGGASTPPSLLDGAALIAVADAALYQAKRTGRDRVVVDSWDAAGAQSLTAPAQRAGSEPMGVAQGDTQMA